MDIFEPCERKVFAGHLKISVKERQNVVCIYPKCDGRVEKLERISNTDASTK